MFSEFRSRSLESERLDRGEFTLEEYVCWRNEMWFIHRLFGETRALRRSLLSLISVRESSGVSILDVGAGSGTLLSYLKSRLRDFDVRSIGVEMSDRSARGISSNGHWGLRGNALALPFADNSVDYVFCTLVLHHLSDESAIDLIVEMRRVARSKLIVVDLERSALSYVLFKLLGTLFLQRFTRDDGSLSIKRAFTFDELKNLAERSALGRFKVERSAIGRLILMADG